MSLNHIISLERPAQISIDTGRLKIRSRGTDHFFALSDVAVLCLDDARISVSKPVLQSCGEANIVVLITDAVHMPCLLAFPYGYNHQQARRSFLQAKYLETSHSAEWWQKVLVSKLQTQAQTIRTINPDRAETISRYAKQVKPGDPDMVEAKASRIYWTALFGKSFMRDKRGARDATNSRLNYGFAIVRAAMARVLSSFGLHPAFGIGHKRKDNPFNLVEDMMEPYRSLVERYVSTCDPESVFCSQDRLGLLKVLEAEILINKKHYRAFSAMELQIQSYCRALEKTTRPLILPEVEIVSENGEQSDTEGRVHRIF